MVGGRFCVYAVATPYAWDVVESARESWGAWPQDSDVAPLEFRVLVEPGGELTGAPAFRKQAHLLSFVSDAHNFAVADAATLTASFHLAEKTAADRTLLRWYYLDALAYMLLTQRYVISLHAACVARNGCGILLGGPSGAGKSTLSVACARAGFTFVADDCTWVLTGTDERIAIGKPHQVRLRHDAVRHFPELEGHTQRVLPNGKLSMEAPTSIFTGIRTARRVPVGSVVFLNRTGFGQASIQRIASEDAFELLLADLPSYGAEVNAAHERTVASLAELPAWRLSYCDLDDAIRLLSGI